MRTVRRFIYSQVLQATAFVALAFVLLFLFFDLIDQLENVRNFGARGYSFGYALLYIALQTPARLYELLPIAVLIGTIYVMAKLAQNSEFTILRTSGLNPLRALRMLLLLGFGFSLLTFALGDYVAPATSRIAQAFQARFTGDFTVGRTGAWMRDRQQGRNFSVNVGALTLEGRMNQVRIFAFDSTNGRPLYVADAASATFGDGVWQLHDVVRRVFDPATDSAPAVRVDRAAEWNWPTAITSEMVAAALLSPEKMPTVELFEYVRHLQANGESAQRYEIELWRKLFYPLGCLVMMVLALPFGYLHFRSQNLTAYVFTGVLFGISFFLLNNVFGFVGNLRNWIPWLTALAPSLVYSALSLGLFSWLVLRR
jgi:lipopolysaccharide export system permease protein